MSQRRLRVPMIGASVIAAAALVTACSSPEAESGSSSEELVVMSTFVPSDYANPAYESAIKAFTEETGIQVKSVFSSAVDIYTAYETSVLAGEEPDVLMANLYDKALTWTETGATVPATDYVAEWGLDDVIKPAALADWTDSEGRIAAFPYIGFTWPVWYNTTVLASAGVDTVPTTTDELIDAAGKLRAAGIAPVAIGGSDWSGEKFLLQIIQATTDAEETKSLMAEGGYCASDTARAGIDNFVALKDGGVFIDDAEGLTADNMYASFNEGQAAIMPAGSWAFANTPEEIIPDIELGGFPIPEDGTFEKPTAFQAFTANGIWLTGKSEARLSDVEKFVKFMYSAEVVNEFVASAGIIPTTEVENIESALGDQPLLLSAVTTVPETVEYGVFPDFFVPGEKTQALITATSSAYASGATTDSICAALDSVYN